MRRIWQELLRRPHYHTATNPEIAVQEPAESEMPISTYHTKVQISFQNY